MLEVVEISQIYKLKYRIQVYNHIYKLLLLNIKT